uniref:3-hydroxyacyl-CoA dehydrogenase NAD-binding domain-containing protein n=1 Tax=Bosea sp. NBC_00436 TaxID=2969620 RepID=A0A9E7ZMJ5_9HYPH
MLEDIPKAVTRTQAVRLERDGKVGFIVIDNPPINAGSLTVREGLIAALEELARDGTLEAGVLIGADKTFVAGSDLREFSAPLADPQMPAVVAAIEANPKPIVAAIHGAALGGGYEIALGCDGRVAVADAVVGLPEGTFGIIPGAGGTVRMPRLTDAATALEIISTCRRVRAVEAKALGLIDEVVEDLRAGAARYALAMKGGKRRLRDLPAKPTDPVAFDKAAAAALKRGRNRPFAQEQVAALRRTMTEPFDVALVAERAVFQRLRQSDESAALRHLFFAERDAARIDGLAAVKPLPVKSVGIVGAGTMGCGIAAAFLAAGLPVTLVDLKPEVLEAGRHRIADFLVKAAKPAALSVSTDFADLADCELVLEAVFEDMAVKQDLLRRLDGIVRPDAILASNTSYLDLDRIAAATARPERVVGLHFFAPAHVMKLLEIVRGARTAPEILATTLKLGRILGKVAVVSRVGEGFIGNRIYNAYRTQCEAMLLAGALPQEIDAAMESFGFAMGPFAVSDLSGLDIAWANRKRKQAETGDKSDLPVLEWLVEAGRLGRKTGAGWYRYEDGRKVADPAVAALVEKARAEHCIVPRHIACEDIQNRAAAAIVNEALLVLEDGIAERPSDIDLVLVNGYGFPKHLGGPLWRAKHQDAADLARDLDFVAIGSRRGDPQRMVKKPVG